MAIAFLGLGSNLGDRFQSLEHACNLLSQESSLTLLDTSSLYETAPVGIKDQPSFLNQVIKIETKLSPEKLLGACLQIEKTLGRIRDPKLRYGPRTIDIDILLYDDLVLTSPILTLPHPQMHTRAFVMVPLLEIEPALEHNFPNKAWVNDLDQVSPYLSKTNC